MELYPGSDFTRFKVGPYSGVIGFLSPKLGSARYLSSKRTLFVRTSSQIYLGAGVLASRAFGAKLYMYLKVAF